MPEYPTSIVTDDGWGVIFKGHNIPAEDIDAAMEREGWTTKPYRIAEVHFTYVPRVKNCADYPMGDGFGCDNAGEWHSHWFQVQPSDDEAAKFTVVHDGRRFSCGRCGDDSEPADCPDRHGFDDHGLCCMGTCGACQHRIDQGEDQ